MLLLMLLCCITVRELSTDALHLKARAAEEKLLLHREMKTMIHQLQQQHASLHSSISDTKHPGSKAALVGHIILLESKLHHVPLMFQHHIPHMVPLPHVNSQSLASG